MLTKSDKKLTKFGGMQGKPEFLTLVIENSRSALFTVRDPTAHAWEIISVPSTSVFREVPIKIHPLL